MTIERAVYTEMKFSLISGDYFTKNETEIVRDINVPWLAPKIIYL